MAYTTSIGKARAPLPPYTPYHNHGTPPVLPMRTSSMRQARAPPARLSTMHDPAETAAANTRLAAMRGAHQSRLQQMQPVRVRMSLAFPDKRLIQWDCGKLQVLDQLS